MDRRRTESSLRRLAAGVLAIVVTTGLAALAGVGLARGSINAAQYQYGKVTICHKTKSKKHPQVTTTVSRSALPAHLKHGDTEGACPKAAAPSKGKGSEKKGTPPSTGAEKKAPEKGAEKGAEKKAPEKGADPPAKEKEKEKGEKEKGEKEHGGGGENGGEGNGNGGGGGKGKGKDK